MLKRLLDCNTTDLETMNKDQILKSIAMSEGRILACETIGAVQPMLGNITNAEFVCAMGADVVILNKMCIRDRYYPDWMKGYNIERKRACLNGTIGFNRSLYERAFWGYFIKDNL